jgi:hypothetical protein
MLETYELLDRFELLYSTNSKLSDLRRSYVDQDLSSIFRILPNTVNGDIDDLRKAVTESNLHSIFRLANDEDLRKLILEDNTWKLWIVLHRYINTQFIWAFKEFFVNNIKIDADCFSRGQLQSKLWIIKELKKLDLELGTVFLCAGWYATLATMLFENNLKINKIRSFDKDPSCRKIAEIFNKPWVKDEWRFKSSTQDILEIDYNQHSYDVMRADGSICELVDSPDTIINTSCEHIEDFSKWYNSIPDGKLVILQSNDYFEIDEHVNCSKSISQFSKTCPMKETLFEGELFLPKYTRFMKIGYK